MEIEHHCLPSSGAFHACIIYSRTAYAHFVLTAVVGRVSREVKACVRCRVEFVYFDFGC